MSLSDQYEVVFDVNIDTGLFSVSLTGGKFNDVVNEQTGETITFHENQIYIDRIV